MAHRQQRERVSDGEMYEVDHGRTVLSCCSMIAGFAFANSMPDAFLPHALTERGSTLMESAYTIGLCGVMAIVAPAAPWLLRRSQHVPTLMAHAMTTFSAARLAIAAAAGVHNSTLFSAVTIGAISLQLGAATIVEVCASVAILSAFEGEYQRAEANACLQGARAFGTLAGSPIGLLLLRASGGSFVLPLLLSSLAVLALAIVTGRLHAWPTSTATTTETHSSPPLGRCACTIRPLPLAALGCFAVATFVPLYSYGVEMEMRMSANEGEASEGGRAATFSTEAGAAAKVNAASVSGALVGTMLAWVLARRRLRDTSVVSCGFVLLAVGEIIVPPSVLQLAQPNASNSLRLGGLVLAHAGFGCAIAASTPLMVRLALATILSKDGFRVERQAMIVRVAALCPFALAAALLAAPLSGRFVAKVSGPALANACAAAMALVGLVLCGLVACCAPSSASRAAAAGHEVLRVDELELEMEPA
jgi:hypothetical protein